MTICRQCKKEKPAREFPWLKQRICHACHMWNAMHYDEIPWPEPKRKLNLSEEQKNARAERAKKLRVRASDVLILTEALEPASGKGK